MPAQRFSTFAACIPKVDARLLPDSSAQQAENLLLTSGILEPSFTPKSVATCMSGAKSIYRMYDGTNDYWLNWSSDVNVARAPLAGDTSFRIYFTSDSFEPRSTNLSMATATSTYPSTWYVLGVTSPTQVITHSVASGSGATETRSYFYTFVTPWGEESAPSPASTPLSGYANGTWNLANMQDSPPNSYNITSASYSGGKLTLTVDSVVGLRIGEYVTVSGLAPTSINSSWKVSGIVGSTQIEITMSNPGSITDQTGVASRDAPHNLSGGTKRIYRTVTSGGQTQFYFVAEIPIATTTYSDTVTTVGEPCPTVGWLMPPVDLQNITTLPSGAMCGFSGNVLCYSEPLSPYAWPLAYQLVSDYPIVGIGSFGQTVIVATTGQPYAATGVDPISTTMQKLDQAWPCLSKRGIVTFDGAIYYPTSIGMASFSANGADLATKDLYSQNEWLDLNPSLFSSGKYSSKIFVSTTIGASGQVFSIGPEGVVKFSISSDCLYTDVSNGKLYGSWSGKIYDLTNTSGIRETMSWRSKDFVAPNPINIGAAKIDATYQYSPQQTAAIAASNAALAAANASIISSGTLGELNSVPIDNYSVDGSRLAEMIFSPVESVIFTLFYGEGNSFSKTVQTSSPFALPAGSKYDTYSVQISSNIPVKSVVIGGTMLSLKTV